MGPSTGQQQQQQAEQRGGAADRSGERGREGRGASGEEAREKGEGRKQVSQFNHEVIEFHVLLSFRYELKRLTRRILHNLM